MNISSFFIERPIFATVLAILITVAGLLAMPALPISEYPEIVPPTVVVSGQYPGASPKTIAETVITPLEQQINGVENAIYTNSTATPDGTFSITVTFKLGTDLDTAQVQTQNRVAQAETRLPEVVRQIGLVTQKRSPDLTMVVFLRSIDGRYDSLYLRNYAVIQIKDVLARLHGMGDVRVFGSGDYAMRLWLDPGKIAARSMDVDEVLAVFKVLGDEGIELISSTQYLEPLLAKPGVFTARAPDEEEKKDIAYGRTVAQAIAAYDLGQTVVIAAQACVAVEAMEGTDATIARAGDLFRTLDIVTATTQLPTTLRRSLTVVKVAKPNQDMRFDVPVIGVATISAMQAAGATCLAIEAGKTLLFDPAAIIAAADQAGIAIVAN